MHLWKHGELCADHRGPAGFYFFSFLSGVIYDAVSKGEREIKKVLKGRGA